MVSPIRSHHALYTPLYLTKRLITDKEVRIVDKALVENLAVFYTTLNRDYKWDYTTDANLTTIYFEEKNGYIYGGVYCLSTHKKLSCVLIASSTQKTPYIYPEKDIAIITDAIRK